MGLHLEMVGVGIRGTFPFGGQTTYVQVSNEKNPGWLGYIGDYTTQLYRDYDKPF